MYDSLIDVGAEFGTTVVYSIGTLAMSGLGLVAEYNSIQEFLSGHQLIAVWFAFIGIVALVFAWNLGHDKLLPLLAEQTSS